MLISTKGRYALRVMIDLAENSTGGFIPLKDIAGRQEISEKYLENIISMLTKAGMLEGLRGKGGGYKLTKAPENYSVGSILKVTEGSLAPVNCLAEAKNSCGNAADCKTLPMWRQLDKMIDEFFEGVSLADIAFPDRGGSDYII